MKKLLAALLALIVSLPTGYAQKCGNNCSGGPAKCGGCKTQGANPFTAYSGSVSREISDLELFAGIGEEKLAFKRTSTSRYKPGVPTPLGTGGSWRHNYYWNIIPGTSTSTGETIHIDFPDGGEQDFKKEATTSLYLTAVSATQERIEQLASNTNQYYLWFADGRHLWFEKSVVNNVVSFIPLGMYDKHNTLLSFDWDPVAKRVIKVSEPGGRYIKLNYNPIGNFNVVDANFTYDNPTATGVAVVGEFNEWGNRYQSAMTKGGDGKWRATVPVQPFTSYQYKFVVDGLWYADPANPNTVPAGGPSTGNNSLMAAIENQDLGTSSGGVTPVTFTYVSSRAMSVAVAGQFNNWSGAQMQPTGIDNTWSVTIPIAQGTYGYKFIINGTSWQMDAANSYRIADGYGGYNSRLVVGPRDEAITQVVTNDGRQVAFSYRMFTVGGSIYSTLVQARYSGLDAPENATYTYTAPTIGSRPMLASADDPHYEGAAAKVSYIYQDNGIEGFVSEERSLDGLTLFARLEPSETLFRTVQQGAGTITLEHASGQLKRQTDSEGRWQEFTYYNDGWGMPRSTIDINGDTIYERTAEFGVVKRTTFPKGSDAVAKWRSTTFTNEAKPFFTASEMDEEGRVTTYTRVDPNNRPTRIDYPDGTYETFTYDNNGLPYTSNTFGLVTSHRLRTGATESFTYYGWNETSGKPGNIKTHTDAAGNTTTYAYNPVGLVYTATTVKDGQNRVTMSYYNDRGQVTRAYNPDHSGTQASMREYRYDRYGNRTHIIDELNHAWVTSYDKFNRIESIADPEDQILNKKTVYAYNGVGGASGCGFCSFESHPTSITSPGGKNTLIAYDTAWRKKEVTVAAGTPDAATTKYSYDAADNLRTVTDPLEHVWTNDYDHRNRKKRATQPAVAGQPAIFTEWTYNGVGEVLTEKRSGDLRPTVNEYFYGGGNHRKKTTDPKLQVEETTYDGAGNIVTLKDARQNSYTFEFDGLNRKRKMTYPLGSYEEWSYPSNSNVSTYRTRAGQIRTCTNDNRGRDATCDWNDSTPDVTKAFDVAGRLKELNNAVSIVRYEYNTANRLKKETQEILGAGGAKSFTYAYDADGNRASMTTPNGDVSYAYTDRNQVKTITADGPPPMVTYTYDKAARRVEKALENGTNTRYDYDAADRMLFVDHKKAGVTFSRFDYEYDPANNRKSRKETIGGTPAVASTDVYAYDAVDQLELVKYNFNATNGGTQDPLVTYNYDAAGNRSSVVDNGATTNYGTPNELNQYAAGSLGLPYDGSGNLAGQPGWTYAYDSENRLTAASGNGAEVTFAYDGRNRCVKRTVNGASIYLYYEHWNLAEEYGASGVQARYVHGAATDELLARISSTATVFYHHDALGSTTSLSDNIGNVLERYTYDVAGAPTLKNAAGATIVSSAHGNRFLFTGREWISELKFYDYRNRVYSTALGRFLQTDPIRFEARDANLYRYVNNSPASNNDPYGLANAVTCTITKPVTGPCSCPKSIAGSGWAFISGSTYGPKAEAEAQADAIQKAVINLSKEEAKLPNGCKPGASGPTDCHPSTYI